MSRPLVCGMCGRRICDISIFRSDVQLLRGPQKVGIPTRVPKGRVARIGGAPLGERPRDPNVKIYAEKSGEQDRYRIVHEHKRNGRGPLDRTIKRQPWRSCITRLWPPMSVRLCSANRSQLSP
jgi:hypothetical protein